MESLNDIFVWITHNPAWAGVGVFLIAFFESLALVGLVLPGAAMMFGIGAMVGTDVMALWPTLFWAALGAICGDGVSFWLGRRYHMQLKTLWPLRKHPELIARATDFFYRHGGKSILFGRFIGPIRPVIPAVAGMLEMPTQRFILFNVISGILWAPVYIFPGLLFATSLGLAAEVASRLAVMVGSFLAALVFILWFSKLGFDWLHRHTYPWMQRLLWWSRLHPVAGRIPASLLDPNQPEARGLTLLALLLITMTLLFSVVMTALGVDDGLMAGLDYSLKHTMHNLRTPGVDRFMVVVSQMGDLEVILTLSILVLAWLWHRQLKRAAWHWLAALGLGALLGMTLSLLGQQIHAAPLTQNAMSNGFLLTTIAGFGFLSVLANRELPLRHRWWLYALASAIVLSIIFARLYLGELTLGAAFGVMTLGLAWVSLLGIGYRNHPTERIAPFHLLTVALAATIFAMAWHVPQQINKDLVRYAYEEKQTNLSIEQWQQNAKDEIPRYRADLRGQHNHPINLQYAGSLQQLTIALQEQGWRLPPQLDIVNWMLWLNPETPLKEMPVLPQVHDGLYHELLLTQSKGERIVALRLWHSPYRIGETRTPLWLGNVAELKVVTRGGLSVPRTQTNFDEVLQNFRQQLKQLPVVNLLSSADGEPVRFILKASPLSDN